MIKTLLEFLVAIGGAVAILMGHFDIAILSAVILCVLILDNIRGMLFDHICSRED